MIVLGIGGLLHDPSAALLIDGRLVAATESEKVTRHHREISVLPLEAMYAVLDQTGVSFNDVDLIVSNWDGRPASNSLYLPMIARYLVARTDPIPSIRLLVALAASHDTQSITLQVRGERTPPIRRVKHHLAHVGISYTLSPFEEAAVAIIDGAAETDTTSLFHASGRIIRRLRTWRLPFDSLGNVFAMVTQHLGFRMLGDEYKVMALGALGGKNPAFDDFFSRLIEVDNEGDYRVNGRLIGPFLKNAYNFPRSTWHNLLPPRRNGEPLEQIHFDFARAMQQRVGDAVVSILRWLKRETGSSTLCLGGGVVMNSVINGRIATEVGFDRIHIPPCAHDGGTSAGAAAYLFHHQLCRDRPAPLANAFLGPSFSDEAIEQILRRAGVAFRRCDPAQRAAELISAGDVVGWFQGAAEFGPRALGARSILGDARDVKMRTQISQVVKERETFRPLAPAVLAEHYARYFPDLPESPYMTYVGRASAEASKAIPAALHVDGTARPQSVDRQRCPLFHSLISRVHALTGVPAVINTSFNMSGEPIVRGPADAVRTLYSSQLRHLVIGSFHVWKENVNPTS